MMEDIRISDFIGDDDLDQKTVATVDSINDDATAYAAVSSKLKEDKAAEKSKSTLKLKFKIKLKTMLRSFQKKPFRLLRSLGQPFSSPCHFPKKRYSTSARKSIDDETMSDSSVSQDVFVRNVYVHLQKNDTIIAAIFSKEFRSFLGSNDGTSIGAYITFVRTLPYVEDDEDLLSNLDRIALDEIRNWEGMRKQTLNDVFDEQDVSRHNRQSWSAFLCNMLSCQGLLTSMATFFRQSSGLGSSGSTDNPPAAGSVAGNRGSSNEEEQH